MEQYYEMLANLQKENLYLKQRLKNIELQTKLEEPKKERDVIQELLCQAASAISLLQKEHQMRIRELEKKFKGKLKELQEKYKVLEEESSECENIFKNACMWFETITDRYLCDVKENVQLKLELERRTSNE